MSTEPIHHSINYVEITVSDMARAKSFYEAAFGWKFNDYGPAYAGILGLSGDGTEVGGLSQSDERRPLGGPFVILYSNDLDATAAAITETGGRIANGPYEFPGGRRLHFLDPDGNELGVWSKQ